MEKASAQEAAARSAAASALADVNGAIAKARSAAEAKAAAAVASAQAATASAQAAVEAAKAAAESAAKAEMEAAAAKAFGAIAEAKAAVERKAKDARGKAVDITREAENAATHAVTSTVSKALAAVCGKDCICGTCFPDAKPLEAINLASAQRTLHILYGDYTGGGHLWPGAPGKSVFPESWSAEKMLQYISDIVTDPTSERKPSTGNGGLYTNSGKPAKFVVIGEREGVKVKVVFEPAGEGIITAYPL